VRILIDAHMVGERETGNETYVSNLVHALARLDGADDIIVATAHPDAVGPLVAGARRITVAPVSPNPLRRLLRDLPAAAARVGADVLLATYTAPPVIGCPVVVVVHDVSFKRHPAWFSRRDRLVLTLGVGTTVRRAAAVLTLSEFCRREIAALYPIPAERIHVTPLAPAPHFTPEEGNDAEVLARHGIRKPYVLAVGNIQPRKNLLRLVEAYGRLASRHALPHDLVLVGQARWQASEIGMLIRRLDLGERVRAIGYARAEDLPALYRGADLFVYPSLYEGFGLPVLESMACGTPVLASEVSAIPEVAGTAARLVDPLSVGQLEDGIEAMCSPAGQRAAWREEGLVRSRQFTWERTARQTMGILRGAAAGHTGAARRFPER